VSHQIYDLENCKSYTTDKTKLAFMMWSSVFPFLFGNQCSLSASSADGGCVFEWY